MATRQEFPDTGCQCVSCTGQSVQQKKLKIFIEAERQGLSREVDGAADGAGRRFAKSEKDKNEVSNYLELYMYLGSLGAYCTESYPRGDKVPIDCLHHRPGRGNDQKFRST